MKSERQEMHADLFKGMATETMQVTLSQEVLDQARRLAEENAWSEEEAFQIILANGLFYLLGQRRLAGLDGHDAEAGAEVTRLAAELMDMQSKYAVMKFRAFTLQQDNQTLEFQNTGLRGENGMAIWRLDKFREDEELLKAEVRRLQQESEHLRRRLALLEGQVEVHSPRPSIIRSLLPWLRH